MIVFESGIMAQDERACKARKEKITMNNENKGTILDKRAVLILSHLDHLDCAYTFLVLR